MGEKKRLVRALMFTIWFAGIAALPKFVTADSGLDLLAGFDKQRIESAYPPGDTTSFSDLAKMVYRLGRIQSATLSSRESDSLTGADIGEVVAINGSIDSLRLLKVPEQLVEFLGFDVIQDTVVQIKDAEIKMNVISSRLPSTATVGDKVAVTGIVIARPQSMDDGLPLAIVASAMKWFPKQPPSDGWRLLSEAGVDLNGLAEVANRNRQQLQPEDSEAFYKLLSVSDEAAGQPLASEVKPKSLSPVELLKTPKQHVGEWLKMRLRTVRVTRVAITEPSRREQVGKDHYYQIDATGDLGDVVVKLARPPGEQGDPIMFDGMYPVSLVALELPDFLSTAIVQQEGGEAVAAMISKPVEIEGFFFRLWSYSSDFMERQNAGDQFGPLIVVANMYDRTPERDPAEDVNFIGYVALVAILLGLVGAVLWNRRNSDEDLNVRRRRQDRESQHITAPTELPGAGEAS